MDRIYEESIYYACCRSCRSGLRREETAGDCYRRSEC
ncbi:MAG: TRASH domain-containing protein, partial [Alistipes sp.]|nr:TRASH domain-containing protein [Alistipes sp.]